MNGGVLAAVAAGGALGSLARYLAVNGLAAWLGRAFPYGTLAANVTGSFLMGLALALLAVEALVSAMVVAAKQPEGAGLPRLAVGLGVLAVAAGLGAVALLV